MNIKEQYHELTFYSLALAGKNFIHSPIVDAFAQQMANEHTRPITIIYALAGLYLMIGKKY